MSFAALPVAPRRQAGLSLIELMIAMVIGLVLILGLVQVFGASRQAYQLSQGIARNQENGRFAVDFLSRDLRMAGHTGCVNDQQLLTANAAGNPIGGNIRSLFLNQADRNSNNVAAAPFRCASTSPSRASMPMAPSRKTPWPSPPRRAPRAVAIFRRHCRPTWPR